jgi:6-phosphogluconolactonase
MKIVTFILLLSIPLTNLFSQKLNQLSKKKLLIGTYTDGDSKGIYLYQFDKDSNSFIKKSVSTSPNPSFLAITNNNKYVYAVNELGGSQGTGRISSFEYNNQKSELNFIDSQSTFGDHPCHVTLDATEKWLVVSNYNGGSFCIYPLLPNGKIGEMVSINSFKSKDSALKSHVHTALFSADNKFLFITDLGLNTIAQYPFDEKDGRINTSQSTKIDFEKGVGPRHLVFHPSNKYLYSIEELSGSISMMWYAKDKLEIKQHISTLPQNFMGKIGSADIHISPNGKFLYASNRGESNDIAIFSINKKNGMLTAIGHQSTLGIKPRNFVFDESGKFLLVANQLSNKIVVFSINKKTGLLTNTNIGINVPSPVCLKWIN